MKKFSDVFLISINIYNVQSSIVSFLPHCRRCIILGRLRDSHIIFSSQHVSFCSSNKSRFPVSLLKNNLKEMVEIWALCNKSPRKFEK